MKLMYASDSLTESTNYTQIKISFVFESCFKSHFEGFEGDGKACTDVDECTNGSHDCSTYAACKNNEGSFECECDSGKR